MIINKICYKNEVTPHSDRRIVYITVRYTLHDGIRRREDIQIFLPSNYVSGGIELINEFIEHIKNKHL